MKAAYAVIYRKYMTPENVFLKSVSILIMLTILPVFVWGEISDEETADQKETESRTDDYWSIQIENDVFTRSGDKHYTHGMQLSWMVVGDPPNWLKGLSQIFPAYRKGRGINAVVYTIGHKMFTPEDVESEELVEDEMPYAGYLYGSVTLLSHITGGIVDKGAALEFTLGIVGPDAGGEAVQNNFHDFIGVERSNGWEHQLNNEIALGVSYSRMWRVVQPITDTLQFGVSPHLTATVGNVYTFGAGGVMFRMGTHLDSDIGPPTIKPGFPGGAYFGGEQKTNWYFFAGTESRIVIRNIFLDGNTFSDSHSVDKEYIVGDLQFGVV